MQVDIRCASCPPTRPHTRTHIHSFRAALTWVLTGLHEITLHEMKLTRTTCCASAHLRPASSAPGKHSCQRSQASWSPLPSRLLNRLDRRGWSTSGGSRRSLTRQVARHLLICRNVLIPFASRLRINSIQRLAAAHRGIHSQRANAVSRERQRDCERLAGRDTQVDRETCESPTHTPPPRSHVAWKWK